jgi:hypothetical protein
MAVESLEHEHDTQGAVRLADQREDATLQFGNAAWVVEANDCIDLFGHIFFSHAYQRISAKVK